MTNPVDAFPSWPWILPEEDDWDIFGWEGWDTVPSVSSPDRSDESSPPSPADPTLPYPAVPLILPLISPGGFFPPLPFPVKKGWTGKRNKVKKGCGPDAREDESDDYPYADGHFYTLACQSGEKPPTARVVFEVCRIVAARLQAARRDASRLNRWGKRRMPNAYAWLDKNRDLIADAEFHDCLAEAKNKWTK